MIDKNINASPPNKHAPATVGRIQSLLVNENELSSSPEMIDLIKLIPNPKNKLKSGPAIDPVIAILANPFLAIAGFAIKSPIELPHASTVIPRKAVFILKIIPKNLSMSTRMFATHQIQTTDINKLKIAYRSMNFSGACFALHV